MQVTALSSSDSVRLRLEDASPAEELRKGIRHRPDTEIFFLVYVLAVILLCESAVGREARKYGLDMTYFHILVIFA